MAQQPVYRKVAQRFEINFELPERPGSSVYRVVLIKTTPSFARIPFILHRHTPPTTRLPEKEKVGDTTNISQTLAMRSTLLREKPIRPFRQASKNRSFFVDKKADFRFAYRLCPPLAASDISANLTHAIGNGADSYLFSVQQNSQVPERRPGSCSGVSGMFSL